jgi:ribosome modulation factor
MGLKMDLQEKVEQAYQEGKDAYFNGKNTQDNPYTGINENHQWEAWKEGYYNAAWND